MLSDLYNRQEISQINWFDEGFKYVCGEDRDDSSWVCCVVVYGNVGFDEELKSYIKYNLRPKVDERDTDKFHSLVMNQKF